MRLADVRKLVNDLVRIALYWDFARIRRHTLEADDRAANDTMSPLGQASHRAATKVLNPYSHIETKTNDGVLVLTILESQVREYMLAEELRYELVHAVKRSPNNQFILNLEKMEFMTSLACVSFIGLKHAVKDKGGRLVLCNVSPFIRKILDAKRLLSRSHHTGSIAFEAVESLDDALAACRD